MKGCEVASVFDYYKTNKAEPLMVAATGKIPSCSAHQKYNCMIAELSLMPYPQCHRSIMLLEALNTIALNKGVGCKLGKLLVSPVPKSWVSVVDWSQWGFEVGWISPFIYLFLPELGLTSPSSDNRTTSSTYVYSDQDISSYYFSFNNRRKVNDFKSGNISGIIADWK